MLLPGPFTAPCFFPERIRGTQCCLLWFWLFGVVPFGNRRRKVVIPCRRCAWNKSSHDFQRGVREEIWDCLSFGHKPEINAEFPRGPEELELNPIAS